jgi:hypothetical protein
VKVEVAAAAGKLAALEVVLGQVKADHYFLGERSDNRAKYRMSHGALTIRSLHYWLLSLAPSHPVI